MKIGKYLMGLAAAGLLTLISGCTTYQDELARFLPRDQVSHTKRIKAKKSKKSKSQLEKITETALPEQNKQAETETISNSTGTVEEKRSELDLQDDAFNFFRIQNTESLINAFIAAKLGYSWDADSNAEGIELNLPQVKLFGKFGPELAGRGIFEYSFTQQNDFGDPEDHEDKDLTFKLSDVIGGFGWHFGDKDLMGYAELRVGAEYLDFDGPVEAYARDMLIGAKGKLYSDKLQSKLLLSILASTGIFGGVGDYKGSVGVAGIPIEGEYGRLAAKAKITTKLTEDLYATAKVAFDRKKFDDYMTLDNYLGSAGIEGRCKIGGREVSGSVDFYARKKSQDVANGKPDDSWMEYGIAAEVNLNLGKGVYFTTRVSYDYPLHDDKTGEFNAELALRFVLSDLFGYDSE